MKFRNNVLILNFHFFLQNSRYFINRSWILINNPNANFRKKIWISKTWLKKSYVYSQYKTNWINLLIKEDYEYSSSKFQETEIIGTTTRNLFKTIKKYNLTGWQLYIHFIIIIIHITFVLFLFDIFLTEFLFFVEGGIITLNN